MDNVKEKSRIWKSSSTVCARQLAKSRNSSSSFKAEHLSMDTRSLVFLEDSSSSMLSSATRTKLQQSPSARPRSRGCHTSSSITSPAVFSPRLHSALESTRSRLVFSQSVSSRAQSALPSGSRSVQSFASGLKRSKLPSRMQSRKTLSANHDRHSCLSRTLCYSDSPDASLLSCVASSRLGGDGTLADMVTTSSTAMLLPNRFNKIDMNCDIRKVALLHLKRSFNSRSSIMSRASSSLMVPQKSKRTTEELRKKFQDVMKVVLLIVKIASWIKQDSVDKAELPQTLRELHHHSKDYVFSTEALVFNKSDFSSSSTVRIPSWARILMEMEPQHRSSSDVQNLCSLLRRLKKFRDWFSVERQKEFCKHCQYTCVDKRKVLVRAGHRGYFCYLIFSGSVFVNIRETDELTGKEHYKTEDILKEGSLFGDSSLIYNVPHTATMVTREKTELLVLDKEACLKILPAETNRELEVALGHIRKAKFLSDWPENVLQQLAKCTKLTKYSYDSIIETDTQSSDFIYMILEGNMEVLTGIDISSSDDDLKSSGTGGSVANDPFSDTSLFERMKFPNQCSSYQCQTSPTLNQETGRRIFVSLDLLGPYSVCDLRSLLPSSLSSAPSRHLILLSHCATVMKFPKLKLETLPPNRYWRQLLLQARDTPRYSSDAVLLKIYEEHLQWSMFKSVVVGSALDIMNGRIIVNKPLRTKGVCGWVADMKLPFQEPDMQYEECLQSPVPLHEHKKKKKPYAIHGGLCLLDYQPVVCKYSYVHNFYKQINME